MYIDQALAEEIKAYLDEHLSASIGQLCDHFSQPYNVIEETVAFLAEREQVNLRGVMVSYR